MTVRVGERFQGETRGSVWRGRLRQCRCSCVYFEIDSVGMLSRARRAEGEIAGASTATCEGHSGARISAPLEKLLQTRTACSGPRRKDRKLVRARADESRRRTRAASSASPASKLALARSLAPTPSRSSRHQPSTLGPHEDMCSQEIDRATVAREKQRRRIATRAATGATRSCGLAEGKRQASQSEEPQRRREAK